MRVHILHEEFCQSNHDEGRQEDCFYGWCSADIRDTDITFFNERTINHVNDAVGADNVRTEHTNFLVVPCYRVTCNGRKKEINVSATIVASLNNERRWMCERERKNVKWMAI